jgi:hypothetical protein
MADTKEITAEELVAVLKFTPRTYRISMWGYGGEKVMGVVDPKVWDYCLKHRVDLVDMAWGDYDEIVDEQGLDPDMLPFTPGSWYECDSMAHVSGVSRNAGTIQITDENNNTVFEKSLDACDGSDGSPQWSCQDEVWIGSRKKGEVVFVGSSNEKGTFFEGDIELTEPFDIEKLELYYEEIDGEEIINCAYYNGEEIENYGGSTDGKSSDMDMVRVIDDEGNWERYEVPDEDDQPETVCTSETWDPVVELDKILDEFDQAEEGWSDEQKTAWIPAKVKPVHLGMYECQFKKQPAWPWPPTADLTWNGKKWLNDDGEAVKGVKEWRGLREPAQ